MKRSREVFSSLSQAEMFKVMFSSLIHVIFMAHPPTSALSYSLLDVIATGNQMKRSVTMNKITDFSGFGH